MGCLRRVEAAEKVLGLLDAGNRRGLEVENAFEVRIDDGLRGGGQDGRGARKGRESVEDALRCVAGPDRMATRKRWRANARDCLQGPARSQRRSLERRAKRAGHPSEGR